jgi:membrane-bound ClpP family serine protease
MNAGALVVPIVLQVLAIIVVIAEFVLPSMGLLTAVALGLFGYSLYLVFTQVSVMAGITFLVIDMALVPVFVIVGIRLLAASPVTLRASLDKGGGAVAQPFEWETIIGVTGVAVTDLRPSGTARFNGKRYDVVSGGEYIEKASAVVVVSAEGNRIVVKKGETTGEG